MKKLFILSSSILLLTACGNGANDENEEANEEPEVTESAENSKDSSEEENEENEEESELTEEEAEEKARDYINENEDYDADDYVIDMRDEDEDDDFYAVVHAGVKTDEYKGNPILHEYKVDRVSGEVEEVSPEDFGPEKQSAHISEIVSMSQEEKDEHHREIAQDQDQLDESVLDNLLLPGLHENTKEYEGRINPDDTIEKVSLKRMDDPPYDEEIDIPEADEEGYFMIEFADDDLKNISVLTVVIEGKDYEGQVFEVPINEPDNKMDYISVHEDANE